MERKTSLLVIMQHLLVNSLDEALFELLCGANNPLVTLVQWWERSASGGVNAGGSATLTSAPTTPASISTTASASISTAAPASISTAASATTSTAAPATTPTTNSEAISLIRENIRRFSVSYFALAITMPDMFGDVERNVEMVELYASGELNVPMQFWREMVDTVLHRNGDEETLKQLVEEVVDAACNVLFAQATAEGLLSRHGREVACGLLGMLVQVPEMARHMVEDQSRFLRAETCNAMQLDRTAMESSFVGTVLLLMTVDEEHFEAMRRLLPPTYAPPLPGAVVWAAYETLRTGFNALSAAIHSDLLLPLVRNVSNGRGRKRIVEHFALLAYGNRGRAKMQAEPGSVCTDGWAMAAWAVLLRLCDPFAMAGAAVAIAKLPLVDVNVCVGDGELARLLGWLDVDRAGLDSSAFSSFLRANMDVNVDAVVDSSDASVSAAPPAASTAAPPAASTAAPPAASPTATSPTATSPTATSLSQPNFITQVFFVAIEFMRLGPLRLVRKYGQTSREFVELEGELGRIEGLGATTALHERLAARLRARMAVLVDIRLCLDLHLKNEQLVRSTAGLLVFLVRWMGTLSSKTLRALPEFFFEAALEWVLFETQTDAQGIFWDETLPGAGADASSLLLRFFMALMREAEDGEFVVHNPYLRAKAAEIVFVLAEDARRWERVVCGSIDTDELAGSLAALYVQVEALGTSTAFYDKFTIRFHVARALLRMFDGSGRNSTSLRDNMRHFKTANEALLVRFLNLVVGDATYLLDEAFTKLAEIKDKETRRDELAADAQRLLAQTERQCESLLLLGAASLDLLAALAGAESVRCTLLRPELLPRLAAMLNFNLVLLAGPRCAALKVRDPGRYRFNPRALLGSLLDVYLSMGGCDVFVRAVGEDERSFSTRLLDATLSIMRRTGMAEEKIASFEAFCAAVQNAARRGLVTANGGESGEEGAEDAIPDDFLDPILFTLMTDPVLLPTSQIVIDRSTITAHLLNDPHDPFNRQPLRSEDLLPCPSELKTRLDLYLAQRRGRS